MFDSIQSPRGLCIQTDYFFSTFRTSILLSKLPGFVFAVRNLPLPASGPYPSTSTRHPPQPVCSKPPAESKSKPKTSGHRHIQSVFERSIRPKSLPSKTELNCSHPSIWCGGLALAWSIKDPTTVWSIFCWGGVAFRAGVFLPGASRIRP
jgi:hypothetical protein